MTAGTAEAREVARPISRVGLAEVRGLTANARASVETTGERIRVVMTIEQISNRLGALCAHGAAVLVAASALETSDTLLIRNRLIGYIVGMEDGKMKARELELKELIELAIEQIGRKAA